MLAGAGDQVGQRVGAALGGWAQRVGAEQRRDDVEFLVVVAAEGDVQADREVATFAPDRAVGEGDDAAAEDQHVPRRIRRRRLGRGAQFVGGEEPGGELRPGTDGLGRVERHLIKQSAGVGRVLGGVGVDRPAAVDGHDAVPGRQFGVSDRDLVLPAGPFDGERVLLSSTRVVEETECSQDLLVELA